MKGSMKMIVSGVMPAACAALAATAAGEKVDWPQGVSAQPPFALSTQPAPPAPNADSGLPIFPPGANITIDGVRP